MEDISNLIAAGRLEEALDLLAQSNSDAILLKSRHASGKRQYTMGMVDFSEWQRVQNQVAYAALELVGSGNHSTSAPSSNTSKVPTPSTAKKVFISYNHKDKDVADQVKKVLTDNGVAVTIDRENMDAGESITGFIRDSIRDNNFVLSIVSENSLRSGWVGKESTASFFAEWLSDKHFIPVYINPSFFESKFYVETLKYIDAQQEELKASMAEVERFKGDTRPLKDDYDKLFDLRSNLGLIIQRLKSVLVVDISGKEFEAGMSKVIARINQS
jgi:hypothetical protein